MRKAKTIFFRFTHWLIIQLTVMILHTKQLIGNTLVIYDNRVRWLYLKTSSFICIVLGIIYVNTFTFFSLLTVDDAAYPPQKKSFMMLRHMYDHHVNDYDWFLRVDDDVYVDYERLSTLLNSLNSSMPLFFGTPGFGIDEDDGMEEGQLCLYRCFFFD